MRAVNWHAWKRSGPTLLAAGFFVLVGVSAVSAQERITWTDVTNAEVRGNSVAKTRGCDGCSDAGATSMQEIQSDGGYVEFRVPEDWTYLVAGLASRTRGTRVEDIEFGIRLNGNGSADIVENGQYAGGDTDYQAGDTFRIEVVNDRVRYLRNGDVMATSRRRATLPLAFDIGFGSLGASVANAQISAGGRNDNLALNSADRDDFQTFDRNNDGVITRREWTGTTRAFNDRDTNGDGQITFRELDGGNRLDDPFNDVVGTGGDIIPVSATERWTDTGLTVRAGDSITIEADGTIQMSGDRGDTAEPAGGRRNAPGALVRNARAGMMIGRIGNGAPFAVGARRTITRAPASGRLYLGVNDDYLEDNAGQFNAMVSVGPGTQR
jgi:hypothetical protein